MTVGMPSTDARAFKARSSRRDQLSEEYTFTMELTPSVQTRKRR